MRTTIEKYCIVDDLSTYDPYDIWKTPVGLRVKSIYNRNRYIGMLPAVIGALFDFIINNSFRIGYKKQEYPMVRSLAALSLLTLYRVEKNPALLKSAKSHIDKLISISSKGYSGFCCGMNAPWASKNGQYPASMPYSTNTPYALEAMINYSKIAGTYEYDDTIASVFEFLEHDLIVQHDNALSLALSYAPIVEPRIVINANSYSMLMYALLLDYLPQHRTHIIDRIERLYQFIVNSQSEDGSWNYYADSLSGNFIDCFHSCFILKNIIKTSQIYPLNGACKLVQRGYAFLRTNLVDAETGLCRRFAKTDKPGLVKYDLYDNAEMLALAVMLNNLQNATDLAKNIENYFVTNQNIYSVIDRFGIRRNRNMLRWAVMPYLYALAEYSTHAQT